MAKEMKLIDFLQFVKPGVKLNLYDNETYTNDGNGYLNGDEDIIYYLSPNKISKWVADNCSILGLFLNPDDENLSIKINFSNLIENNLQKLKDFVTKNANRYYDDLINAFVEYEGNFWNDYISGESEALTEKEWKESLFNLIDFTLTGDSSTEFESHLYNYLTNKRAMCDVCEIEREYTETKAIFDEEVKDEVVICKYCCPEAFGEE
ncbi:hypothetical protein KHQ81_15445 (plasmid) [Mycoplasmatota bacterium]|nr:hypothetical protein KHQ81_15445 [Mycoplasmatota bacterium]